jgi:hypothetical protein
MKESVLLLDPAIQQIVDLLRSEARQEIAQQILGHVDTVVPHSTGDGYLSTPLSSASTA